MRPATRMGAGRSALIMKGRDERPDQVADGPALPPSRVLVCLAVRPLAAGAAFPPQVGCKPSEATVPH